MSHFNIRCGDVRDYQAVAEVMYDAVRNGKSRYTEAQKRAWVPEVRSGLVWESRLNKQRLVVAEYGSDIIGFMTLADGGYIDFAYVRPTFQGQGLFRMLYERIEVLARGAKLQKLWVHASLMARRPFGAIGFVVVAEETVDIGDQTLRRFEMEKCLS